MPMYTAEYTHGGYVCEHHLAESEAQVLAYFRDEHPWLLPVLVTETADDLDLEGDDNDEPVAD